MTDARPTVSAQTPESRAADRRAFREAELVRSLDHRATVIGRLRQSIAADGGLARRVREEAVAFDRRLRSRVASLECEIIREEAARASEAAELASLRPTHTPTMEITP